MTVSLLFFQGKYRRNTAYEKHALTHLIGVEYMTAKNETVNLWQYVSCFSEGKCRGEGRQVNLQRKIRKV